MEFSVKLAALPEGVTFPERFREKLRYDAERGVICYQGFMTKCAYDELSTLSSDAAYHRALEQLFVLTSGEIVASEGRGIASAAMVAVVAVAAVAVAIVWGMVSQDSPERVLGPPVAATASNGS